jgi:hypothetical protein
VLEGLDEEQLMEIDRTASLGNVSLTTYARGEGGLELQAFGDTRIVDARDAEVTRERPAPQEAEARD